jgi:hypothetical protein
MNARKPSHINDAVDEIAHDMAHREFTDAVCAHDVAPFVNADTAVEWIGLECALQTPQGVLHDLIDRLTDADAALLLVALTHQDLAPPFSKLAEALYGAVGAELMSRTEDALRDMEPTERELANDYGDPLASEARSFARKHNASLAAWRVLP